MQRLYMAEYDPNQELLDQMKIELEKLGVDLTKPETSGEKDSEPKEKETV